MKLKASHEKLTQQAAARDVTCARELDAVAESNDASCAATVSATALLHQLDKDELRCVVGAAAHAAGHAQGVSDSDSYFARRAVLVGARAADAGAELNQTIVARNHTIVALNDTILAQQQQIAELRRTLRSSECREREHRRAKGELAAMLGSRSNTPAAVNVVAKALVADTDTQLARLLGDDKAKFVYRSVCSSNESSRRRGLASFFRTGRGQGHRRVSHAPRGRSRRYW